jgi:hypothetical protein
MTQADELSDYHLPLEALTVVSLQDLLRQYPNRHILQSQLIQFKCALNSDVETFLHRQALRFEEAHKSRTYLVVPDTVRTSESPTLYVFGYFTLALKHVPLGAAVSNTRRKAMHGLFMPQGNVVVGYLLGQLGKHDYCKASLGSLLVDSAIGVLQDQAQRAVGGRFVLVECAPHEKLLKFYAKNGFSILQDDDEGQMIQLIRQLS